MVLLIGTNDLDEHATPEIIAGNMKLILTAMKASNPRMPIILCQVFPSDAQLNRSADQIKKVNALYLDAVKNDPQIIPLDTWTLFADEHGDAKPSEFPDLLHPNRLGYAKWAAALDPVFATLQFTETDPAPFTPEEGFESLFDGQDLNGWGTGRRPRRTKRVPADGRRPIRTPRPGRSSPSAPTSTARPPRLTDVSS